MSDKQGSFIGEFKEFITRGNVIDLAVGIIVGGAFTSIVTSLVNDVIMPVVGMIMGGVNFANLKYVITPATEETAEAAIRYGAFIQSIVNFVIVAFVIFMLVRTINKLRRKQETPPAPVEEPAPPEPSDEAKLLVEIRDLLKNK